MLDPPNILFTGESGVGKTTILNLFPEDIILELDDNLNEVFQKQINIIYFKGIEQCILREIDLRELVNNFVSFHKLLQSINIICIITDSTERNVKNTQQLLSELKYKLPKIDFYIIANFQDRKSISMSIETIEHILKEKTYGFSAIQEDSKDRITDIIKDILKNSFIEKQGKNQFVPATEKVDYNMIWSDIEEARLLERRGEHFAASKKFSIAGAKLKILNSKQVKEEFEALYYLCKAWECMELAEEYEETQKFSEAVKFFNQVIDHLSDKKLKLLTLGNLIYCEALKLGLESDESEEPNIKEKFYIKATNLIKKVGQIYRKIGYDKEAEWALSTLDKLNNP